MPGKAWTDPEIIWLKKNYQKLGEVKAIKEFQMIFPNRTYKAIKHKALRMDLVKKNTLWKNEEINWLTENYPKLGTPKVFEEFRLYFGDFRSNAAIINAVRCLNLSVNEETKHKNRSDISTRLKDPVGTIKYVKDARGNRHLKIKNENRVWVNYPRYFWNNHKENLKNNQVIIFLDGDNTNVCLENMVAMPRSFFWKLLGRGWVTDNYVFNVTAITVQEALEMLEGKEGVIFGKDPRSFRKE